jgi:hypothetical protein
MTGARSRLHPILLAGLLSLGASTLLEWLLPPGFPGDILQGFLDGFAAATLFGHLLLLRAGRLKQP